MDKQYRMAGFTDTGACLPVSGVLNIDKPKGLTSHDVVARVRGLVRQKRVGHTGTLDPLATGVLVVCVGKATRIAEYIAGARKTYLARLCFGVITDTLDADGRVVEEHDWRSLARGTVERALEPFRGRIQQIPPMFSALKRDGRPLYRLARQGVEVERAPRTVEIHHLALEHWQPPEAELHIVCSSGTYVRSLVHDLGIAVGVGAHLTGLTRESVGRFSLREAASLEALEGTGEWMRHLTSIRGALDMPGVLVEGASAERVLHGGAISLGDPVEGGICFVHDVKGCVLAILQRDTQEALWRPVKVLASA